MLYVISATNLGFYGSRKVRRSTGVSYHIGRPPSFSVRGLPLVKPPYSRITAINLKTGKTQWVAPNGETPDFVRNHPALAKVNFRRPASSVAVRASWSPPLCSSAGEGSGGDPILWAYDKMHRGCCREGGPAGADDRISNHLHEGWKTVHRRCGPGWRRCRTRGAGAAQIGFRWAALRRCGFWSREKEGRESFGPDRV